MSQRIITESESTNHKHFHILTCQQTTDNTGYYFENREEYKVLVLKKLTANIKLEYVEQLTLMDCKKGIIVDISACSKLTHLSLVNSTVRIKFGEIEPKVSMKNCSIMF